MRILNSFPKFGGSANFIQLFKRTEEKLLVALQPPFLFSFLLSLFRHNHSALIRLGTCLLYFCTGRKPALYGRAAAPMSDRIGKSRPGI